MLLESISSDIDVNILLELWPKDWKAVQSLLEEQVLRSITFASVEKRKRCGDVERQV